MKSWAMKILAAAAVLVVGAAIFVLATGTTLQRQKASAQPATILADEATITTIYDNASPAVVEIKVTSQLGSGARGSFVQSGQGSGFVIDNAGDIVTNNHVVDGATSVQVIFSTGKTVSANVLGKDSGDDLAVVKVDQSAIPSGLTPLVLADSSAVKPGQTAIALGSPYGLANSITTGVISGINRSAAGGETGMIQTDANIQPGNSGGPLLNSSGQVVGVNTSFEGQGTGIGFAVPSNVVSKVLTDLKASKQISKPWIGITGLDLTQSQAQTLGLSVSQGAYVITVASGSPAEAAGLKGGGTDQTGAPGKGGDVITAIDGKNVTGVADIQNYLATKKVGDVVTLTILRGGSNTSVSVTLGARPDNVTPSVPSQPSPGLPFPFPRRGQGQ